MEDSLIIRTGTIHKIFPTQTFQSGFQKREIVLKITVKDFTNYLKIEAYKGHINFIDNLALGDTVKVKFFLGGTEWQPKDKKDPVYFTSLKLYDIEVLNPNAIEPPPEYDSYTPEEELPF